MKAQWNMYGNPEEACILILNKQEGIELANMLGYGSGYVQNSGDQKSIEKVLENLVVRHRVLVKMVELKKNGLLLLDQAKERIDASKTLLKYLLGENNK